MAAGSRRKQLETAGSGRKWLDTSKKMSSHKKKRKGWPKYAVSDIFLDQEAASSDHFRPLPTTSDHFRPLVPCCFGCCCFVFSRLKPKTLDHFRQFPAAPGRFRQLLCSLKLAAASPSQECVTSYVLNRSSLAQGLGATWKPWTSYCAIGLMPAVTKKALLGALPLVLFALKTSVVFCAFPATPRMQSFNVAFLDFVGHEKKRCQNGPTKFEKRGEPTHPLPPDCWESTMSLGPGVQVPRSSVISSPRVFIKMLCQG